MFWWCWRFSARAPLQAVQVDEILPDPGLEARARAISHDLRCMVCQNQSIDNSEAPLARDLRLLVRERLKAGDSDLQVVDFMVARYGEFVLLRPRVELAHRNPVGGTAGDFDGRPVCDRLLGAPAACQGCAPRTCKTQRRGAVKAKRNRAVATVTGWLTAKKLGSFADLDQSICPRSRL